MRSKLKAVHFVQDDDTGLYQVVGVYRNIAHTHLGGETEYETMVLDEGLDYYTLRGTFLKTAKANQVEPFDLVTSPYEQTLALMKREG